ncbi:phosphopentomutase [Proteinivorax hydrogeniformans]|uniref:Phosphopentomutase n=1 Tax=Proteinivorax hydrogeniformans TaxID=1826727 RepID=A0AAU8HS93_9FIRM
MNLKKVILVVVDSLGVGAMADVCKVRPQDVNANTLQHILNESQTIKLPNLEKLGINHILGKNKYTSQNHLASFGKSNLMHYGADSYAGHQEIMGTRPLKPVMSPFVDVIDNVKSKLKSKGYKVNTPDCKKPFLLVNDLVVVADNIETDYGQIYNVTAPLDSISFEEVLKIGKIVRDTVRVNRVIALGGEGVSVNHILSSIEIREDGLVGVNSPKSGVYNKGYQVRHMGYGVNPKSQISTILAENNYQVSLIGKMQDVISCSKAIKEPAVKTQEVMEKIVKQITTINSGLIAATVQETDLAGHAQDVEKYAEKLIVVDRYLQKIIQVMDNEDLLIITADHGNDPTVGHSQHTREQVPILVYGKSFIPKKLECRRTLSDIAATIADYFNVTNPENGQSFLSDLRRRGHENSYL